MDRADYQLYRDAIHGDQEAFELAIKKMSRPLFAIAFGALQNREEAEDSVQDAFVRAWKARWRVRDPEKFPAWISTIVRRRAHDILMRRKTIPLDEQFNEIPSEQAQSWLADAERHQKVHAALATLPELYRSALALRYLEELDYATIERLLGLSNGALRGILGRALATMRKRLKPKLEPLRSYADYSRSD
jgi:RNA polymerase sigma-70 factor (ECF subfamily)